MARVYREYKQTALRCGNCGQQFEAPVLHIAHGVAESSARTPWIVDRIDARCPSCNSYRVEVREG